MSRFNTPEEVKEWAMRAAADDIRRHREFGISLNPYCTVGARNDWQRGFDNKGPRSYESPEIVNFCLMYNRGHAAAILLEKENARKSD